MVYVHVPFCRSFCTYCDFYSEIACRGRDAEAIRRYTDGLVEEIERRRAEINASSGINTLYIGGGTPSVLPLSVFDTIVEAIGSGPYEEFTVEVNPEDIVERGESFALGLKKMGVNRISIGVQCLDDKVLKWMNRRHDSVGAGKAFDILRECGFGNISVDVIYGISGLTDKALENGLTEIASEWKPEHISAYQLTVEDGSTLSKMVDEGKFVELNEESCRRQYETVCRLLSDHGYSHYEISNWALPGFSAKHNSAYWTRAPYVGLGPGAHSLTMADGKQIRSWNTQVLSGWHCESEILTDEEIREERLMLGLRTTAGVDGTRIEEKDWFIADTIIAEYL